MKIFISEADKLSARRIALKNIAQLFNISDWEIKSNEDLLEDIASLKIKSAKVIFKLLTKYFEAYDEWFLFYQKRKKQWSEYILTDAEQHELENLIKNRVNSLNALLEKFDELQHSNYNRETFGQDIKGIIYNE